MLPLIYFCKLIEENNKQSRQQKGAKMNENNNSRVVCLFKTRRKIRLQHLKNLY